MSENILSNIIIDQAVRYKEREAISYINEEGKALEALSYTALAERVKNMACGLETLGLKPGDVCMTFSSNRPEMVITDFACYYNRAIPVSIYSTSSSDQVLYIMNDCKPRYIMVGNQRQYDIVMSHLGACPWIQQVIAFFEPVGTHPAAMTMAAVEGLGEHSSALCHSTVEKRRTESSPEDIATLIYTSGTTGEPKGVELPHSCFNAVVRMHHKRLTMLSDQDTSLCFLPLCHIFEKAWTYYCITQGMHVAVNENPKEIATAIKHVRPTCMCSVPRFWEKAYIVIHEKMAELPVMKRWMANLALRIGHDRNLNYVRLGKKAPWWLEFLYQKMDKLVFKSVRRAMGVDRGNIFPTAGAPISSNIVEFFHSMGVNVLVGYGLSETTATVTCFPTIGYEIGTVGTVMPELEVRIVPQALTEDKADGISTLSGEIQVKGPTVMRCYYNKPEATAEALTEDGWLRTGDAGYFDESGALVLTERLKDLFKTSNGKYIAPQAIESRLGEDRYIEQVAVVGESRKYVTAIIIPAIDAIKEYAKRHKIMFKNIEDLLKNSEIVKMIGDRIDKLQQGLPSFEQIKKFTLLPHAFTIENGELTNTLKIRRPVINSHYAKEIEAMYV